MVRPDLWWEERKSVTRSLIYKKRYKTAYKISSEHSLSSGPSFAEAEWLSGWIWSVVTEKTTYLWHFQPTMRAQLELAGGSSLRNLGTPWGLPSGFRLMRPVATLKISPEISIYISYWWTPIFIMWINNFVTWLII